VHLEDNIICSNWGLEKILSIHPFGKGHINDTYLVKTARDQYILQRVNKNIFRVNELISNYELIADRVLTYQEKINEKITPEIYKTRMGTFHYVDKEDFPWRLVEFIQDAQSYDLSSDPSISQQAAQAVGKYQLFLNTLDPDLLKDTIPGFHNLPSRFLAFQETCKTGDLQLVEQTKKEIQEATGLASIVNQMKYMVKNLPQRIIHNDTKLNNIIFDGDKGMIIDLDTVMKGFVMFDFGDMVRTFTSPAKEDEKDLREVVFRTEHFEALTKGYLEYLKSELTLAEKHSLFGGAIYILYEQLLRFLTDYLLGSPYYKTDYPTHNLVRARTQLALLKSLLQQQDKLEKIVRYYS
jgi:hypothetical protein